MTSIEIQKKNLTPPKNVKSEALSRSSHATTAKKMYEKRVMNEQSCCFAKYDHKHIDILFASLLSIYS